MELLRLLITQHGRKQLIGDTFNQYRVVCSSCGPKTIWAESWPTHCPVLKQHPIIRQGTVILNTIDNRLNLAEIAKQSEIIAYLMQK